MVGTVKKSMESPKQPKPLTMPAYDGFGFHQDQGRTPIAPEAGQRDPEEAIGGSQFRSFLAITAYSLGCLPFLKLPENAVTVQWFRVLSTT